MDGNKVINIGRKQGLSSSTIYQPYVKLYNTIKGFIDLDYFGLLGWSKEEQKWVPMHVNSDKNPFPETDYFKRKCRRAFKWRDMLCHAHSRQDDINPHFVFLVSSPHRRYALICLDFDGEDYEETCLLRKSVYESHFKGLTVFDEPSRNRRGCYMWIIIERDSSPAEFNALCNALTLELRRRYHDLGQVDIDHFNKRRKDRANFFDGIKGTCHYDDRDAFARLTARMEGNPNDNHRGLLVTMPCSGFERDADGNGHARMRSFIRFAERKKGVYANAIPQAHLRNLLASFSPTETVRHVNVVLPLQASVASSLHQLVPSELGRRSGLHERRSSSKSKNGGNSARADLINKARLEGNPQGRMRLASCLFFYEFGRYAETPAELVGYYEGLGLHSGLDVHRRRHHRAAEALTKHKTDPARQRTGVFFDAVDWLPLVNTYVTDEVKRHSKLKYRYRIEDELLAAALCLFTASAMKPCRIDRMHTCGQQSQLDWYESLSQAGVITSRFRDKSKRVDIPKMLQLAGLVVLRDSNHKYGGAKHGICDKYGLGKNHPLHQQFVRTYGDIVDPSGLPCIINRCEQQVA